MLIEQIITERYVNLIHDDKRKDQYKDEVFDLLQKSYANIGGIKGSGLESPENMKSIPFWKLAIKNGKVVAVVLYKDKNGRKAVATGNDGTITGKRAIQDIVANEPNRSYAEKSKAALGFLLKVLKKQEISPEDYLIEPDQASAILNKEVIPVADFEREEDWPVDEKERETTSNTLARFPFLIQYGYFREINNEMLFKVMAGTPNLTIT